jgi:hypothetical protein
MKARAKFSVGKTGSLGHATDNLPEGSRAVRPENLMFAGIKEANV